jgi:outer membrane protein assembly factor BamB
MKLDTKSIGGGVLVAVLVLVVIFEWNGCPSQPQATRQIPTIAKKWEFSVGGPVVASLALANYGTLYVGSEDGYHYAIDDSGKLQWKFYAAPIMAAPIVGSDGAVYVSNRRGRVFALNISGTQRWEVDTYDGDVWGKTGGAITRDFFYAPTRDGLCAIGLNDGEIRWKAGLGFEQFAAVTLLPNGLLVFPARGRLHAVNSDGETVWQYPPLSQQDIDRNGGFPPPGGTFFTSGIAPAPDGTLIGAIGRSGILAVGWDGTYKWQFQMEGHPNNSATPLIAADGTIYQASGDCQMNGGCILYALNSDGSQKWALDTHAAMLATPLLAEDGTIYVASGVSLLGISPAGKIVEQVHLPNAVESAPTLGPDGTLYVATNQGKVLAFATKHGGLMNSAWPKYQGDLSNSGRARSF